MFKIRFFLFLLLLIPNFMSLNADIHFQTYVDRTRIGIQDRLTLTLEVSGSNIENLAQPSLRNLDDFEILGTSSSSSSSISIVNNRMERTVTRSFIYTLKPQKTGNFLIPPLTISIDNKSYTSNPITINVVEGSVEPPPPTSRSLQNQAQPRDEIENIHDNLFIKIEYDDRDYYRGEPVILNYYLYSRYDISNLSFSSQPNYEGFWKEDIFRASRLSFQRRNYRGLQFNTLLLKTVLLIPTQTGLTEIDELTTAVDVVVRARSFFDFDSSRRFSVSSERIKLNILPLPTQNRPQQFSGAIGNFTIDMDFGRAEEYYVGDSVTLNLTIDGWGNFQHFDNPWLENKNFLRILDPEVSIQTSVKDDKQYGYARFRFPVILTQSGNFEFPAFNFNFFNPVTKTYHQLKTEPFHITIKEGEMISLPAGIAQRTLVLSGQDIGYLKTYRNFKNFLPFFNSFFYWFLMFLIILSIPASYLYAEEKSKESNDYKYRRQKYASKILKKYMNQSEQYYKNQDPYFYTIVYNGLASFLCDFLILPKGSSKDEIFDKLKKINVPAELLSSLENFFDKCNRIRFMPDNSKEIDYAKDLTVLKNILTNLNKLKKGLEKSCDSKIN